MKFEYIDVNESLIHVVAENDCVDILQLFLQKGIDLNVKRVYFLSFYIISISVCKCNLIFYII